ncbi:hypothetical protein, partial [Vreelandella venusta]|uniref:hypothetical protein n=1 Tax=Vreelandella venusta TaxID=44935 RepID=UPI003AA9B48F
VTHNEFRPRVPTLPTHAPPPSPRPARALNVVVFMHPFSIGSSRATAGRKGGSKGLFFYAFSCAFMHFSRIWDMTYKLIYNFIKLNF